MIKRVAHFSLPLPVPELVEVVRKINLEVCNRLCVHPNSDVAKNTHQHRRSTEPQVPAWLRPKQTDMVPGKGQFCSRLPQSAQWFGEGFSDAGPS